MDKQNKIKEEAARWFLWLHEKDANKADIEVFLKWQNISQEHKSAYQEIEAFWEFCDSLDDLPWPSAKEIARDRYDGSLPIPLPSITVETVVSVAANYKGRRKRKSGQSVFARKTFSRKYAIAASLFVMLGSALFISTQYNRFFAEDIRYQTLKAEHQEIDLVDGSHITLGPASKISVSFNKKQRRLILHSGEAFFEVAKDTTRPFVVDTGDTDVQAIGTAFNVNKRTQQLTVSVLEGVVSFTKHADSVGKMISKGVSEKVESLRLSKGQHLVYDAQSQSVETEDKVMTRAMSWREGKLAYEHERLSSVIDDVNRYSDHEFIIGDPVVGDLIYTGTVFSNDISNWTDALVKSFPVRALKLDGRVVLLSPLNTNY